MDRMASQPPPPIAMPVRKLKRVEYEQLAAAGHFANERVERVFGTVVTMPPIDPSHAESVRRVDELLKAQLGTRARVSCQNPFAASDESEPEPDVFVFPTGDYWHAHPDRALLVVEVARTSLDYDRQTKTLLYGDSQVDEYWIVNLVASAVEIYRDRRDGRWTSLTTVGRDGTVAMQAFPDVEIRVADILPPLVR